MFNDFHETTRNVGVVGILLGLLVVAGLCGLGMAVLSGTSGPREATLASRVNDQEIHLRALTAGLEERAAEIEVFEGYQLLAREAGDTQSTIVTLEEEMVKNKEDLAKVGDAIAGEKAKFNDYRNNYRRIVRKKAINELIDLSETKGDDYKSVKITKVTPAHLSVMMATGTEGIPYQQLPRAVQDRFQFGADEAANYHKDLNKKAAQRAENMAGFNDRQKLQQGQAALRELEKKIQQAQVDALALRNRSARLESDADASRDQALQYERQALAARRAGRTGMAGGQARKARDKAARLNREAINAGQESARLLQQVELMKLKVAEDRRKLSGAQTE
ncbi:hypothetical protein V2O64_08795 [Verrucomicrobiaceae bacterium 227]